IAIYAIHTNLDHVHNGVNKKISDKIRLSNTRILVPKTSSLIKLVTCVPIENTDAVLQALYHSGAAAIGDYSSCRSQVGETGTFKPSHKANPTIGEKGKLEKVAENRVEVMFPRHLQPGILSALKKAHPYEEVAYYFQQLENENQEVGAGMIGELETA